MIIIVRFSQLKLYIHILLIKFSYKNTISLQIEITKFIYNSKKESCNDEKPLTLFANNETKIILCSQILMTGQSIQDGFGFVIRIIQVNPIAKIKN